MLAIAIAAPVTMLLLAASDQLCGLISSAAGNASAHFLANAGGASSAGLSAFAESPFLAFLVGLFMIGAAFALWIELLMREAAVYVIVLMLPLAFAAMVWPARRIWAVRAVELLVALILSKFAIVAVLSLGGAASARAPGTRASPGSWPARCWSCSRRSRRGRCCAWCRWRSWRAGPPARCAPSFAPRARPWTLPESRGEDWSDDRHRRR